MAETLFIRLGTTEQDAIHWLIWSAEQHEIIASGELSNAEQLSHLTEKAVQREVVCLVASNTVMLTALTVPGKSQRAIQLAAPYMLEDSLAQEVDQLFFAFGREKLDEQGHNCFVAAVAKQQMDLWLSWLAAAELPCKKMIPDVLALPLHEHAWTAITLGRQILCRQQAFKGMAVDINLWPILLAQTNLTEAQQVFCYAQLECPHEQLTIEAMPAELPLALMAQHYLQAPINLLQGQYQVKQQRPAYLKYWLVAASVALVTLVVNVAMHVTQLVSLQHQQAALETEIIHTYKQAFPQTRNVRIATIRSQLKQKLSTISDVHNDANFLQLLDQLKPAFAAVPKLKPTTIKFEGKRNELRIQAVANGYPAFEQFKNQLEKQQLTVKQGVLTSQGEQVSGSFSIKGQL